MYPSFLAKLIDDFKRLPGVGEKTAERMAFAVLELNEEQVSNFSLDLTNAKKNITNCTYCNSLTDQEECNICRDKTRNSNILCVVESSKDVFLFEKTGKFEGRYFVLNGLISPIDGIGPDELPLKKLMDFIKKNEVKEVIIAVKGTIEGETTALYIKKILENCDVRISRIASGIPVGAEMEYVDSLTLESALLNRKEI